jgi:hypothetical protein
LPMTQRSPPSPPFSPPTPLMDLLLTLLSHRLCPLLVAPTTMVARTTTIRATPSIVVTPRRQPSLSGPYFRVHCASCISPWINSRYARSNNDRIRLILIEGRTHYIVHIYIAWPIGLIKNIRVVTQQSYVVVAQFL